MRVSKRVMSDELESARKHGPGKKDRIDGLHGRGWSRVFGITGDWSAAALDPGVWYSTVGEGGCRFIAARWRKVEKASETGRGREKRKRRTRLRC